MHLCEKAKQGLTIPPNLPPELAKESVTGKSITSSKSSEPLTLEDKRKDNFEKGRQELERRRQEMKAQQEKERVSGCVLFSRGCVLIGEWGSGCVLIGEWGVG